jgi:hypothetical protein
MRCVLTLAQLKAGIFPVGIGWQTGRRISIAGLHLAAIIK